MARLAALLVVGSITVVSARHADALSNSDTQGSPHPFRLLSEAPINATLCTNTCPNANDLLNTGEPKCDDGGPGSNVVFIPGIGYRHACELGTDCTDCGPRVVPLPECECCAVLYMEGPGAACGPHKMWELQDWTCSECAHPELLPSTELCGKVSYNMASRLEAAGAQPGEIAYGINWYILMGGGHELPTSGYRDPACANPLVVADPSPMPFVGLEGLRHGEEMMFLTADYPPLPPAPPRSPPTPPLNPPPGLPPASPPLPRSPTHVICADKLPLSKCILKQQKGKCPIPYNQINCAMTCGACAPYPPFPPPLPPYVVPPSPPPPDPDMPPPPPSPMPPPPSPKSPPPPSPHPPPPPSPPAPPHPPPAPPSPPPRTPPSLPPTPPNPPTSPSPPSPDPSPPPPPAPLAPLNLTDPSGQLGAEDVEDVVAVSVGLVLALMSCFALCLCRAWWQRLSKQANRVKYQPSRGELDGQPEFDNYHERSGTQDEPSSAKRSPTMTKFVSVEPPSEANSISHANPHIRGFTTERATSSRTVNVGALSRAREGTTIRAAPVSRVVVSDNPFFERPAPKGAGDLYDNEEDDPRLRL